MSHYSRIIEGSITYNGQALMIIEKQPDGHQGYALIPHDLIGKRVRVTVEELTEEVKVQELAEAAADAE